MMYSHGKLTVGVSQVVVSTQLLNNKVTYDLVYGCLLAHPFPLKAAKAVAWAEVQLGISARFIFSVEVWSSSMCRTFWLDFLLEQAASIWVPFLIFY